MVSSLPLCYSFLHRITLSGETTSRNSFHEVKYEENFAEIIIIRENDYNRELFLQITSSEMFHRVLNMLQILNMSLFWIYGDSECTRVVNMPRF